MEAISPMISDPIRTFLPGADEEEQKLRARLFRASHLGWSRAFSTRHQNARNLYRQIGEVASAWKLAPADKQQLGDMADNLARLFTVAQAFEELEAPDDTGF